MLVELGAGQPALEHWGMTTWWVLGVCVSGLREERTAPAP
jgi:hypothetical protein